MNIKQFIDQCLNENPCEAEIRYDESMKDRTTFRVGGKADCYIKPYGEGFLSFCTGLLTRARSSNVPVFILGGGANIVVSDKGIRGIVLDMGAWKSENVFSPCTEKNEYVFKSGTNIDDAADFACEAFLSGLEFLAGMPGTIGGAVWMNARCYGKEMADVLSWVEIIGRDQVPGVKDQDFKIKRFEIKDGEGFGYKESPFQKMDCMIISAAFKLKKGDKEKMLIDMESNRQDRKNKGHYNFPCAGSAFKNNRDFGKPTGQIIDELGLKGLKRGGAQVAPFHGNIIINTGNADAGDIRALVDEIADNVKKKAGFILEPEILFAGEW